MKDGETDKADSRTTYTYDSYGKVTKITEYPGYATGSTENAIEKNYTYDEYDRVTSMIYTQGETILESYSYVYETRIPTSRKQPL